MIPEPNRSQEATPTAQGVCADPRVRRVLALMEEHYHRELSLDALARSVRLSSWHLCHLFKKEVGVSPLQHLRSLRMRRAGALLATTFLTVKEIMHRVGVRDQSHFAKDFKRTYGLSPTEYRASLVLAGSDEGPQQAALESSNPRTASSIEAGDE